MVYILFGAVFIVLILVACYAGYYFGIMHGRGEGYLDDRLDDVKFKDKHTNMIKRFKENYEIHKKYKKDSKQD